MILIWISAILMMFSAQIFSLSFSIQGLNRAVINTPIEMMYLSVNVSNEGMIFLKSDLEERLNSYYDTMLSRYSKSYSVEYYYYDPTDDSMCVSSKCTAVEITINCKLIANYDYTRVMYYQIKDNHNG